MGGDEVRYEGVLGAVILLDWCPDDTVESLDAQFRRSLMADTGSRSIECVARLLSRGHRACSLIMDVLTPCHVGEVVLLLHGGRGVMPR